MIVRVWSSRPLFGSVNPTCSNSQKSPFASASAADETDDRGEDADHERLDEHGAQDLPARGADRPHGGELPRALRDRDRERVRDHERADEERDAAEGEQEALEEAEERLRVARVFRRPGRARSAPGVAGGRIELDLADELLSASSRAWPRRGSGRACPTFLNSRCAVGRLNAASVAPPMLPSLENSNSPADAHLLRRPLALDADRLADREVLLRRRARVDRDLGRPLATCPP